MDFPKGAGSYYDDITQPIEGVEYLDRLFVKPHPLSVSVGLASGMKTETHTVSMGQKFFVVCHVPIQVLILPITTSLKRDRSTDIQN